MSIVPHAYVCDCCGQRQPEFQGSLRCMDCERHVCEDCASIYDPDPPGRAICIGCFVLRIA